LAYTQLDIDNLKRAIATGAERSKVNDRDVTFRSLKDMQATLAIMEEEVLGPNDRKPKRYRMVTRKGLR
jgi:hypothetical protein